MRSASESHLGTTALTSQLDLNLVVNFIPSESVNVPLLTPKIFIKLWVEDVVQYSATTLEPQRGLLG